MAPGLLNPYRYGAPAAFKPTDISGLKYWFSSDVITPQADNSTYVGGMQDSSGLANHAALQAGSTKYRTVSGPGSGPCLEFGGSAAGAYYWMPLNILSGATASEMFAQVISAADGTDPYPGAWDFGSHAGADACHYPFTPSSQVYENFGGVRQNWTPTVAVSSWRRFNARSTSGAHSHWLDETSQASSASGTFVMHPTPMIGHTRNTGGSIGFAFRGRISALWLFNKVLSSGERADMVTYITANPSGGTP